MWRIPRSLRKSIAVYRCTTSGDRKYPTTPTYTVEGGFEPMDRRAHAHEGGFYVNPFEVYFFDTVDVLPSDKLVIAGTTYYVKKVFDATGIGRNAHKRATLSTEL